MQPSANAHFSLVVIQVFSAHLLQIVALISFVYVFFSLSFYFSPLMVCLHLLHMKSMCNLHIYTLFFCSFIRIVSVTKLQILSIKIKIHIQPCASTLTWKLNVNFFGKLVSIERISHRIQGTTSFVLSDIPISDAKFYSLFNDGL